MIGEGDVPVTDGKGSDVRSIFRIIANQALKVEVLSTVASNADPSIVKRL